MTTQPPGAGHKAQLRSRILAARNGLPAQERARHSRAIIERVVRLDAFRRAELVLAYCSFGSEVDTRAFMGAVHERGKRLVLPRIERGRDCLALYRVDDECVLREGLWGIREPDPARCASVSPGELDFILVPGVAFDRRGGRLGYGKGYYDRLLQRCRDEGKRPQAVAGAFGVQLVEAIPMEHHDIPIDALATETQCIAFSE